MLVQIDLFIIKISIRTMEGLAKKLTLQQCHSVILNLVMSRNEVICMVSVYYHVFQPLNMSFLELKYVFQCLYITFAVLPHHPAVVYYLLLQ